MCQEKMSVDLIAAGEPERFSSISAIEQGPLAVLRKPPELRMQAIEEMACAVAEMYKAIHAVDCA